MTTLYWSASNHVTDHQPSEVEVLKTKIRLKCKGHWNSYKRLANTFELVTVGVYLGKKSCDI